MAALLLQHHGDDRARPTSPSNGCADSADRGQPFELVMSLGKSSIPVTQLRKAWPANSILKSPAGLSSHWVGHSPPLSYSAEKQGEGFTQWLE